MSDDFTPPPIDFTLPTINPPWHFGLGLDQRAKTEGHRWKDHPPLTLDTLRAAIELMPTPAPPPMQLRVVPADRQCRTACDVPVAWVRPRIPSKTAGRRGTRKAWRRRHPPHQTYTYREPTDVLVLAGSARQSFFSHYDLPDLAIVTPNQMAAIRLAATDKGLKL